MLLEIADNPGMGVGFGIFSREQRLGGIYHRRIRMVYAGCPFALIQGNLCVFHFFLAFKKQGRYQIDHHPGAFAYADGLFITFGVAPVYKILIGQVVYICQGFQEFIKVQLSLFSIVLFIGKPLPVGLVVIKDEAEGLGTTPGRDFHYLVCKHALPVTPVASAKQNLQGRGHTFVFGPDRHPLETDMGHIVLPAGIHTTADFDNHIGIIDVLRVFRFKHPLQFHRDTGTAGYPQVTGIGTRAGRDIQGLIVSGFRQAQIFEDTVEVRKVRLLYKRDQDILPQGKPYLPRSIFFNQVC